MQQCSYISRRSSRSSLNSSRSSIPDELNCSFTQDGSTDTMYRSKNIKLEVGKLLGAGGFGTVFEGKCLGRKIALKKLHHNSKNPHAMSESFQAEKAVMSLRHRNIVRILAATNISRELQYERLVVMEYAGQRNLLSLINDENEKITTFRRIRFATDIVNALHYIHKLNIAHLDLKPANIMVTYRNTCKLGDFGCCKILGSDGQGSPTTPTNSYLTGTLAYRSPELLKGGYPTCKADMYSYGICLWQLLTRERPYGNENMYVVIFGVVSYNLRPTITPKMITDNKQYTQLIKSLWRADPDKRPSAEEVMVKLRSLRKRKTSSKSDVKVRWRF